MALDLRRDQEKTVELLTMSVMMVVAVLAAVDKRLQLIRLTRKR